MYHLHSCVPLVQVPPLCHCDQHRSGRRKKCQFILGIILCELFCWITDRLKKQHKIPKIVKIILSDFYIYRLLRGHLKACV